MDASIKEAKKAAKDAATALAKPRSLARTERKKKARLVRKAAQLSAQDLERIAVLKRTGWWDPSTGEAAVPMTAQANHRQKERETEIATAKVPGAVRQATQQDAAQATAPKPHSEGGADTDNLDMDGEAEDGM